MAHSIPESKSGIILTILRHILIRLYHRIITDLFLDF